MASVDVKTIAGKSAGKADLDDEIFGIEPNLPVMLVSGHPLDTRVTVERERWLDCLLQKPYRADELARFVARILPDQPA